MTVSFFGTDETSGVAGCSSGTYSGPDAAEDFGKAWEAAEKEGREKEIAQGVQIITLPPGDIEKMKKLMAPHVEQAIAAVDKEGKQGRKFFEEYTK